MIERNRIPTLCSAVTLMTVLGILVVSCRDSAQDSGDLSMRWLASDTQPIGVVSSIISLPLVQSGVPELPKSGQAIDKGVGSREDVEAQESSQDQVEADPTLMAALEVEARSLLVAAESYARSQNLNPTPKLVVDKPSVTEVIIPLGKWGRRYIEEMTPKYITIHSTQNYTKSANAKAHASLLREGGMRNLSWHFTVDESSIYQSLPTTEQGEHADFNGPGNQFSIGIEMCENSGNSREATIDRTAHLIAWLMQEHQISIDNVVPHQHWRMIRRRDGRDLGHKNCPHFLMEDGEPRQKWRDFIDRAERIYRSGSL